METTPGVYAAIVQVARDMATHGISKDRKQTQANYNFRGIDDVYNALSPALAAASLCIMPRVLSRSVSERETKSGGVMAYVVLDVEFDFVYAGDGSRHTVRVMGEAMDTSDKATNKAMSTAYKYAAFMTFCIPVEGMGVDAERDHHERAHSAPKDAPASGPKMADAPAKEPPKSLETEAVLSKLLESATDIVMLSAAAAEAQKATANKAITAAARKRLIEIHNRKVAQFSAAQGAA